MTLEDFLDAYGDEVYTSYMEEGCYYNMTLEDFEENEYEDYLEGTGHWATVSRDSKDLDKTLSLSENSP